MQQWSFAVQISSYREGVKLVLLPIGLPIITDWPSHGIPPKTVQSIVNFFVHIYLEPFDRGTIMV